MYGFLKSQGEKYQDAVGNGWKIIGFDNEDHLQVGAFNDTSSLRDAVEFHPALIINGENLVAGTGLNEQQPRTAIGQAKDGTVIMLVVDGRQLHSFGISIERCGEIMEQLRRISGIHAGRRLVLGHGLSTAARSPARLRCPRTRKAVICRMPFW